MSNDSVFDENCKFLGHRDTDGTLIPSRMGGLDQLRDWRNRHRFYADTPGIPFPEPAEGVEEPVISSGTPETLETPETPVETETGTITLVAPKPQNFLLSKEYALAVGTDLHKDGAPITITAVEERGDDVFHEYEYLTPEAYAKRWTRNWLNFDLGNTLPNKRTGRRADRRDKLVKSFTTPLRYPFARGCGHQFVELQQPRHRNCDTCWNAYFWNQNEMTENIARNVQEQGPEIVQAIHGKKFLTHFLRFAILLARYEQFRQTEGTECAAVEEEQHEHGDNCAH